MKALPSIALVLLSAQVFPVAATEVGFEISSGRPIVELTVDGRGPFPFVLDTGAPGLIVRSALVDELGLEDLGPTSVTSPMNGRPVETRRVRVPALSLGGLEVRDLEAIVLDFGGAALGSGIVGPAVFRSLGPMRLDFATGRLTIGARAATPEPSAWVEFGPSAPLLDVPVTIGQITIDGHIDTGSPGTLTVPTERESELPLTGPARIVGRARTIDAEFDIRAAPLDEVVRAGAAEIPLDEIHLAALPVANLGTGALRGLALTIDWEGERFALTGVAEPIAARRSGPSPAAQGPRFGLRARPNPGGPIDVVGTDPGSPAEAIGLRAGDRVVAINGRAPGELELPEIRSELTRPDLELTVERDGETVRLRRLGG